MEASITWAGKPDGRARSVALTVLVLSFVSLACVNADAVTGLPSVPTETVTPVFGWQPGFRANVVTTRSRTQIAESRNTQTFTFRYRLRADVFGQDLRVRFEDIRAEPKSTGTDTSKKGDIDLIGQISGLLPDYIVSRNGEFVSLHNVAAVKKRYDQLVHRLFKLESLPASATDLVHAVTSESFLQTSAMGYWDTIAGAWARHSFKVGDEYEFSTEASAPVFSEVTMIFRGSYSARGFVPCVRDGKPRRCLEIQYRAISNPKDIKPLTSVLVQTLMPVYRGPTASVVLNKYELVENTRVLVEPDGLIPHQYNMKRTLTMEGSINGQKKEFSTVEVNETKYSYP